MSTHTMRAAPRHRRRRRKRLAKESSVVSFVALSWRRHHGQHMAVGQTYEYAGQTRATVVTSLCRLQGAEEADPEYWQAHKLRLAVNAGCGFLAVEDVSLDAIGHEWRPCPEHKVPAHIKKDFAAVFEL
jgi:hypothetical protein